jgi:hypothetical protein
LRHLGRQRGEPRASVFLACLELTKVDPCRVDEVELRPRAITCLDDVAKSRAVLPCESEDYIAATANLVKSLWIQLDDAGVFIELARERLEVVERRVVELLEALKRRVYPLQRRELSFDASERVERAFLIAFERVDNPAGDRSKLLGMFEPPPLLLEPTVFVRVGETRVLDLLDDVTQVIGAPFRIGATPLELRNLATDRGPSRVRVGHLFSEPRRSRERVEYLPL